MSWPTSNSGFTPRTLSTSPPACLTVVNDNATPGANNTKSKPTCKAGCCHNTRERMNATTGTTTRFTANSATTTRGFATALPSDNNGKADTTENTMRARATQVMISNPGNVKGTNIPRTPPTTTARSIHAVENSRRIIGSPALLAREPQNHRGSRLRPDPSGRDQPSQSGQRRTPIPDIRPRRPAPSCAGIEKRASQAHP